MKLIQIYQCLCDENRLRILHLLTKKPFCVSEMQRILELSQVKISKHLSYLKKREMVEAKRVGNKVFYSLPENTPQELENNLKCLQDCVQEYPVFNEDLKRIQNETTRSFSSRK